MTGERTPDARVEAAARALYPYMWAENYWPPMMFGQTGTLAERVEEEREIARTKVDAALAAADAVQREGLAERVAEVLRSRVVLGDDKRLWLASVRSAYDDALAAGADFTRAGAAAHDEHLRLTLAAVVAAIYGGRP